MHQRGAEREQQAVQRIAAVGAAHAQLEQHAEHADEHRREQQARARSACRAAARVPACELGQPAESSAATTTQRHVHAEREERPCARLIVSITPTISMKPSAISANSSPSAIPLTRCGRRLAISTVHRRCRTRGGDAHRVRARPLCRLYSS